MGLPDPAAGEDVFSRSYEDSASNMALVKMLEDLQLSQPKSHLKGEAVRPHFSYTIFLFSTPDEVKEISGISQRSLNNCCIIHHCFETIFLKNRLNPFDVFN